LPALDHALVGRDPLLAQISPEIVAQRLLTLPGPAGVGKTNIAQQFVARLATAPAFADRTRWC
jgi:MoxR-like ATPase